MTAGLFLAVDLVLWNHAIADVGAGVATVLGNLQVLFVAVFAWLVLRERPGRRYLVMLPVVLVGVVLVAGMVGGHAAGLDPLAGISFGVGTSAAYACFLLILRTTSGQAPHVAGQLADATAGATAGAIVLGLILGGFQLDIGWPAFGWLLLLALLSQTVGWLLITSSLPRLPAAMSSLLLLLQPAAAMVLADIILGERPTLVQDAGALLVCLGVLAAARTAHGEQDVAIGKASRRRVAAQPVRSYFGPELDPKDRGQLYPASESELRPDLMASRLAVPPPRVDGGGSLPRRPGGRCREQRGELAPAVVVIHYEQVPARPQYAQHLRQARLRPRRKEVGEPRVYHVRARVGQRDVLGRSG